MIKIKAIKPLFTAVVTTMDRYTADDFDGKIITSVHEDIGSVKEIQKVLAVGDSVRGVEVGDLVRISPKRYAKGKINPNDLKADIVHERLTYEIPTVEINGKDCMFLDQVDIRYVITEWEEEEKTSDSGIIHPNNQIIIP